MSTTPTDLPTLQVAQQQQERAKRAYAVMRWAAVIAVVELRDGYDAAMEVVDAGPAQFQPDDTEWANLNLAQTVGINYIEGAK